jgi:hypothetical protein
MFTWIKEADKGHFSSRDLLLQSCNAKRKYINQTTQPQNGMVVDSSCVVY